MNGVFPVYFSGTLENKVYFSGEFILIAIGLGRKKERKKYEAWNLSLELTKLSFPFVLYSLFSSISTLVAWHFLLATIAMPSLVTPKAFTYPSSHP